jgi:peroxiredoxin
MNRFLITLYLVATIAVSIQAIILIVSAGFGTAWGALLASLPAALYFWRILVFKDLPRTSEYLPWLVSLAGLGLAVSAFGVIVHAEGPHGLVITGVMVAAVIWYVYGYSILDRSRTRFKVGALLPDFELRDMDGLPVASAGFRGGTHLFMFYRGNWCPFCVAQIRELAAGYQALADAGVTVVLVSTQPMRKIEALAEQFHVPMVFLQDLDGDAAERLGVRHLGGTPFGMEVFGYEADTAMPTVIVTDGMGMVRWAHVTDNYRLRPDPAEMLEVVNGL